MRILIPVDGSKHSMAAVQFVATHSNAVGGSPEIELLNVQAAVPARAARMVGKAACTQYYEEEATKALRPALRVLKQAGLTAQARHAVGHAADLIAEAATSKAGGKKTAAVDLLVMGSHGHGALMSLLVGSVTQGVLARTTTPMLLLRGVKNTVTQPKIALAIDGSAYGLAAARYVIKHRELFGFGPGEDGAQLALVHVVPDFLGAYMPDMAGAALPAFTPAEIKQMQDQSFEAAMAPVRKLFAQARIATNEVRLAGPAGDVLSDYARKQKLSMLVMGSHGYGALRQAVLGSVATRVAAHCTTPLLLIRKP